MSFTLKEMCRLCAACGDTKMKNLFTDVSEFNMPDFISNFLGFTVTAEDIFSDVVCEQCVQRVIGFQEYFKQCLQVQEFFTKLSAADAEFSKAEEYSKQIKAEEELPTNEISHIKQENNIIVKEELPDYEDETSSIFDEGMDYPISYYISSKAKKKAKKKMKALKREEKFKIPTTSKDSPNKKYYKCDLCSRITKSQKQLDKHKKKHLPKPECVYNCSGCTKVFNSKEKLKSHERTHLPIHERYNYPCTICGTKFTTKSAVVGHTRAVHEKIKRYICDICGYACSTSGELSQHRAIHSEEKLFSCSRCPKHFKTASNLTAHLDTHDSTSYPCKLCDKVLNSRRTFRKHLLVHDDLCRHVCTFCNKAFKRRQTLKVHLTCHTGDTPVKCPWCPQKFAYSSACRTHKQRYHPEQLALAQATSNSTSLISTNGPSLAQAALLPDNSIVSSTSGNSVTISTITGMTQIPILSQSSSINNHVIITVPEMQQQYMNSNCAELKDSKSDLQSLIMSNGSDTKIEYE